MIEEMAGQIGEQDQSASEPKLARTDAAQPFPHSPLVADGHAIHLVMTRIGLLLFLGE
jgi:hypothetical protein